MAISLRPGAHVGERNLLLSAIRPGYRQIPPFSSGINFWCHVGAGVIVTNIPESDRNIFFRKKMYVAIYPSTGAHVGERNLSLSAIRRSYRANAAFLSGILTTTGMRLSVSAILGRRALGSA